MLKTISIVLNVVLIALLCEASITTKQALHQTNEAIQLIDEVRAQRDQSLSLAEKTATALAQANRNTQGYYDLYHACNDNR